MAYPILVCVDAEELHTRNSENHRWCTSENRLPQTIKEMSSLWPNSTLCIYRLTELQKLKTPPTYARYKVSFDGEIAPV